MEAEVQVGKYTLESLTTGMYSDPKIVYREYIQNSVDSLENAVQQGIFIPPLHLCRYLPLQESRARV